MFYYRWAVSFHYGGGELVLLQGASLFTRGGQAKVCPFLRTLHYLCGLCAYNFLSRELSLVERVIALNENGRSLGGFQMKLKINVTSHKTYTGQNW